MTQAQRSARAYVKRKHIAQAELAGAEILDVTIAAIDPSDGHYVIRLFDGTSLHLDLREKVARPTPDADPVDEVGARRASKVSSESAPKPKKVYAPKSWEPGKWNMVVGNLRAQDYSKDEARAEISKATKLSAQQVKHALAVIDAVPDTPDWYDHVPLAES